MLVDEGGPAFLGTERFTAGWFNHLLVPVWLPAMPEVTRLLEAGAGVPAPYDVIFTFDVVHDAVDHARMLAAVRSALRPNGRYVCVDINASDRPEENTGPVAALFYGFSNLYCMTSSLAHGGAGLGTCGFNPRTAELMCKEAGFSEVRTLPLDNPFNNVYEITP